VRAHGERNEPDREQPPRRVNRWPVYLAAVLLLPAVCLLAWRNEIAGNGVQSREKS
jgi:hypothetical protein